MVQIVSVVLIMLVMLAAAPAAWAASAAPEAPRGAWLFDGGPDFPGITLMTLRGARGSLNGELTSHWYGTMPMFSPPPMEGDVLVFDQRNLNDREHAVRRWTAHFKGRAVSLAGDFWYAHVEQQGRRARSAEARARAFHPGPPLPPAGSVPADGPAATPPMGWSSWNAFAEKIDDATARAIADAMVSTGLRDAGYVYVNIDDGWQGTRDAQGELRSNAKFPDMKALADYVHARGLKLGLYTSPGPRSCAGYEGTYGHVRQDAQRFADWGVDYLKYDLCSGEWFYADADTVQRTYLEMGAALRVTGRPIVYSLCEYGRFDVASWGRTVGGHLWRTTGDIKDEYASMASIGFERHPKFKPGGPGGWNDPDMLEIGNGGMSDDEYRTHMSLWVLQSAPLIMSHYVRTTTPSAAQLLLNREVLAIDQDARGAQGRAVRVEGGLEVWRKLLPLSCGQPMPASNRLLNCATCGVRRACLPIPGPWTCQRTESYCCASALSLSSLPGNPPPSPLARPVRSA